MLGGSLPGRNPAAAKARAIQRDLAAKAASRRYDQWCQQQGIWASRSQPASAKERQARQGSAQYRSQTPTPGSNQSQKRTTQAAFWPYQPDT